MFSGLAFAAEPENALIGLNPDSNYALPCKYKKGIQMTESEQIYNETIATNGGKLEIMKYSAGSAQYLSEKLKTLGAESTRRRVKDGWIVSCHVPAFNPTPEDRQMEEGTPMLNEQTEPAPTPDEPPMSEELIEWQRTTLTDEEADIAMRAAAAKRKPSNRRRA